MTAGYRVRLAWPCPKCGARTFTVGTPTRREALLFRRRRCPDCHGVTFTTVEIALASPLAAILASNLMEPGAPSPARRRTRA
jgi:transcriptional regulator NrdR family protein